MTDRRFPDLGGGFLSLRCFFSPMVKEPDRSEILYRIYPSFQSERNKCYFIILFLIALEEVFRYHDKSIAGKNLKYKKMVSLILVSKSQDFLFKNLLTK